MYLSKHSLYYVLYKKKPAVFAKDRDASSGRWKVNQLLTNNAEFCSRNVFVSSEQGGSVDVISKRSGQYRGVRERSEVLGSADRRKQTGSLYLSTI